MRRIIDRIRNSEFLTFSEVLRLKVTIVTTFIVAITLLSIFTNTFGSILTIELTIIVQVGFGVLILITMFLTLVNLNRFAMHFSIITFILMTWYLAQSDYHFVAYMMFFVSLTVILFYQDISTYLIYGLSTTAYGVFYVFDKGALIIGTNAIDADVSLYTYLVVLIGFYVVFLIQFLVSDNIYEKMNNEWVRMNKVLARYQELIFKHLVEMIETNEATPIYKSVKFQQAVSEISIFINEFFEENANNIAEVVEFYFFLHDHDVDKVIESSDLPIATRKYASQLSKYLLNQPSELVSILFGFSTLFREREEFSENRYEYNLDKLYSDRIDKLLSLAMLYKFLKTEITQIDRWGNVKRVLTHKEITEMFISKEFREFITYEQVNFYLDNEDLFEEYL